MKSYNVVIGENKKEAKNLTVQVESEEDFVKWVEILSSFEENEKISYEEIIQERTGEDF